MTNICATITKLNSNEMHTTYVCISKAEEPQFRNVAHKYKLCGKSISCMEIDGFPRGIKPLNIEGFDSYMEKLVFHKEVPVLVNTITRIIDLPESIICYDGRLAIISEKKFSDMQYEDCVSELELAQWVLRNFPQSHYASSRVTFALAEPGVKYRVSPAQSGATCLGLDSNNLVSYRYEMNAEPHKIVEFQCIYENRLEIV